MKHIILIIISLVIGLVITYFSTVFAEGTFNIFPFSRPFVKWAFIYFTTGYSIGVYALLNMWTKK